MGDEKSKRAAPRIRMPFSGTATIEGETTEVVARDLSESGAFLWSRAVPQVGDKVQLELLNASGDRLHLRARGAATVVRVEESEDGMHGFAVHFEEQVG